MWLGAWCDSTLLQGVGLTIEKSWVRLPIAYCSDG